MQIKYKGALAMLAVATIASVGLIGFGMGLSKGYDLDNRIETLRWNDVWYGSTTAFVAYKGIHYKDNTTLLQVDNRYLRDVYNLMDDLTVEWMAGGETKSR